MATLTNGKYTCRLTKNTYPPLKHSSEFYFVLNANNSFGTSERSFTFNLSSIVKLDPPEKLFFNNETNILSWNYPNLINNVPKLFKFLKFKLVIKLLNNEENDEEIIILNNTNLSIQLDLKPYSRYNFKISCIIENEYNKNWSDMASINSTTKEDSTLIKNNFYH